MNQFFYLKSQMTLLSILLLFTEIPLINGQASFNPNTPQSDSEFKSRNQQIAYAFGPALFQWIGTCDSDSGGGDADRILKVNYDNNWSNLDNWEHLDNLNNPSFGYDVRPHGYYAVTWTDNFWIIVYTFYYARDWAFDLAGCGEDEHEGDFAKAFVVAKRAQSTNDRPEDLLLGYGLTKGARETCIDIMESGDALDDINAIERNEFVHPLVSSATGSHHYFSGYSEGHRDGNSPCRPLPTGLLKYLPATYGTQITPFLSDLNPDQECISPECPQYNPFCGICQMEWSPAGVVSCSENEENYGLIDIFNTSQGLWAQRTNGDLFTQSDPLKDHLSEQRLICESGGCTGFPVSDKDPYAPWTGAMGLNPLEFIHDELNSFNCDCNDKPNCDTEITTCDYVYNPYLCEFYDIETPSHFDFFGSWVSNPHESGGDLYVVFTFSAFDGFTGTPNSVSWDWDVPTGTMVSCQGCNDDPANRITLRLTNTTKNDVKNNPGGYRITAEANFIECGTITKEASFQNAIDNLINQGGGCEKLVLEIKDEYHLEGNQYDWSFPLYDALATISTDGRRVEFDTETVLQQTSETTNPDSVLAYHLKVTNPAYADSIEIDSSMKIPDCQYDGGLSLVVFPNPTSDNIFVKIRGIEEPATDLEFVIFDHQFNQVSKHPYSTEGQNTVSVARLQGGIYYLYAITGKGKILCEKFCVIRH